MTKFGNVIAASILGVSLVIAALIVNSGLRSASEKIRGGMVFPTPPSVPDTITVRTQDGYFRVAVSPTPLTVELKGDAKAGK
jgi:hypothetical protein